MTEETKSFKSQLDEIREHLEKCKLQRVRRNSEFTRRVDDIKARHERLTSGRLRRLSFEGIIVDIDKIRSHKQDSAFGRGEAMEGKDKNFTLCVRREKTDNILTHYKESEKHITMKNVPDSSERSEEEKLPYKQFRLEFAFDGMISSNLCHQKTRKLKNRSEWRNARTKSVANLKQGMQDENQTKHKLQSAFTKVLRVQRFTSQRRHTILSMAPIDIGDKSKLPTAIICGQSPPQPNRMNSIKINSLNMTGQCNVSVKQTPSEYQRKGFKEQSRQ